MAKLDTSPYKGVRDFYPEDEFIQNYIFSTWKKVVEIFGYEQYDASILEPSEIYKEKSGDEIVNEQTFTFIDRGGRDVTLRPEMTPTVARMVAARRRELGFPLRWYSIPNLFRYEAPQRGRLREHWQLNVDVFGLGDIHADVEIIVVADKIMQVFGAHRNEYEIRMNTHGDTAELEKVIEILRVQGITNTRIDESLARGQAYYTGVVFEFFDTDPANPRSILGGGRYDNLTALFGDSPLAAVGFGAGDVTIKDFLETHNLLPQYSPATKVWIAMTDLDLTDEVVKLSIELRMSGINVAVDWSGRKLGDQLKTADKLSIPYVLVVGENEVATQTYSLKKMDSGEEIKGTLKEIVENLNK
jgi:histidyl-tRNA synthetase